MISTFHLTKMTNTPRSSPPPEESDMELYIISPNALCALLKSELAATDEECQIMKQKLVTYGIGKGCNVSINIRKKKPPTRKKKKEYPPLVVNKKDNVSLKGLSYAAATSLILKEHGPLNAKHLYEYVKAYGWVCKKGGKTPKSTFGAMLSTGVAQGKFVRAKGEDGHYIYTLAPPPPKTLQSDVKTI